MHTLKDGSKRKGSKNWVFLFLVPAGLSSLSYFSSTRSQRHPMISGASCTGHFGTYFLCYWSGYEVETFSIRPSNTLCPKRVSDHHVLESQEINWINNIKNVEFMIGIFFSLLYIFDVFVKYQTADVIWTHVEVFCFIPLPSCLFCTGAIIHLYTWKGNPPRIALFSLGLQILSRVFSSFTRISAFFLFL